MPCLQTFFLGVISIIRARYPVYCIYYSVRIKYYHIGTRRSTGRRRAANCFPKRFGVLIIIGSDCAIDLHCITQRSEQTHVPTRSYYITCFLCPTRLSVKNISSTRELVCPRARHANNGIKTYLYTPCICHIIARVIITLQRHVLCGVSVGPAATERIKFSWTFPDAIVTTMILRTREKRMTHAKRR